MTKPTTFGTALVGALLASIAIAGCGTNTPSARTAEPSHPVATPSRATQSSQTTSPSSGGSGPSVSPGTPLSSSTPSRSTATGPVTAFPTLIQMAMADVPSQLVPAPLAPTTLPAEPSRTHTMYFDPTILKSPGSYTIQLSAPHQALASFGAAVYPSAQDAANAAAVNRYAQGPAGTVSGHERLSATITGTVLTYTPSSGSSVMTDRPWTAIQWQEGRWTIRVTHYAAQSMPTSVAKRVVAVLNQYYLPVPQMSGHIYVSLSQPSGSTPTTEVDIQWDEGRMVYSVDAYNATPINTAVRLAVSMTAYPPAKPSQKCHRTIQMPSIVQARACDRL